MEMEWLWPAAEATVNGLLMVSNSCWQSQQIRKCPSAEDKDGNQVAVGHTSVAGADELALELWNFGGRRNFSLGAPMVANGVCGGVVGRR